MIHYVENTITKEKMDKMGQYDLNSMRSALVNMEEQITILSDSTTRIDAMQNDIQKLYE